MNLFCLTIWGVFPLHFFASIVRQWSKMQHPVAAGNRKIYRRQKMGFVLIHIAYFFLKLQDVVVFILNTATESGWLSPWDPPLPWGKVHEEFTAPQHTRFILPLFHPTKSIAALRGRYFSFTGNAPWKFHEPTERDTDFSSTPLQNRGRNFVRSKRRFPLHEQHSLYLFFAS